MKQRTYAARDDINTAQGAVPFAYGGQPSPDGPEFHPAGAVNPDLPGKDEVELAPRQDNPPRPERPSYTSKPCPIIPLT